MKLLPVSKTCRRQVPVCRGEVSKVTFLHTVKVTPEFKYQRDIKISFLTFIQKINIEEVAIYHLRRQCNSGVRSGHAV